MNDAGFVNERYIHLTADDVINIGNAKEQQEYLQKYNAITDRLNEHLAEREKLEQQIGFPPEDYWKKEYHLQDTAKEMLEKWKDQYMQKHGALLNEYIDLKEDLALANGKAQLQTQDIRDDR